jgi:membrane-associated protease RseP (regulator of RpoE activity)
VKIYLFEPSIVRAIKVPPILPLFPYVDKVIPNLGLPSFYFTYFIVVLAIVAISHEMAHGIFMRRYGIKIKSTGFAFFPSFFPIFPAAFVEQDETSMGKSKTFEQLAVLSAGTFANVIVAIISFFALWLFFSLAFVPNGLVFDSYATSGVVLGGTTIINGVSLENPTYEKLLENVKEEGLTEIEVGNVKYFVHRNLIESQETQINQREEIVLYPSGPAIEGNLSRLILEINGVGIGSIEDLQIELAKHSPGDEITVRTEIGEGEIVDQKIILAENPSREGVAWLGVGFFDRQRNSLLGKIIVASSFRDTHVSYEPKFDVFSDFIYNLLWWLVLISISVALINMLPVGMFDGGRFFYLTVLGLTKSEKVAKKAFKFSTGFFLFLLFLIMFFWAISWF